jgi:hypothetical protein
MKQITLVNSEGEIELWMTMASDDYVDGSSVQGKIVKLVSTDTDVKEFSKTNYWDFATSSWQARQTKPDEHYFWKAGAWVFDSDRFTARLKSERDRLLYNTDWTQGSDSPLSDSQKANYAIYRQALRDLPQINEATIWSEIAWPAPPQ